MSRSFINNFMSMHGEENGWVYSSHIVQYSRLDVYFTLYVHIRTGAGACILHTSTDSKTRHDYARVLTCIALFMSQDVVEYKRYITASESKSSRNGMSFAASITAQIYAPRSSPSANLSKTPIRSGPLAFLVSGVAFRSFLATSQCCMYIVHVVPHSLLARKSPNNGADIPFIHCCTLG
jgi:hypothetical protein